MTNVTFYMKRNFEKKYLTQFFLYCVEIIIYIIASNVGKKNWPKTYSKKWKNCEIKM